MVIEWLPVSDIDAIISLTGQGVVICEPSHIRPLPLRFSPSPLRCFLAQTRLADTSLCQENLFECSLHWCWPVPPHCERSVHLMVFLSVCFFSESGINAPEYDSSLLTLSFNSLFKPKAANFSFNFCSCSWTLVRYFFSCYALNCMSFSHPLLFSSFFWLFHRRCFSVLEVLVALFPFLASFSSNLIIHLQASTASSWLSVLPVSTMAKFIFTCNVAPLLSLLVLMPIPVAFLHGISCLVMSYFDWRKMFSCPSQ